MSKQTILLLIFSIVLGLIFFGKTFNPDQIIVGDDTISLHYPAFIYYHENPSSGWNPTLFGGFSTDIFGLAAYYPPVYLLRIFPATSGFGLFLFIHFLIAFWGMYGYTSILGLAKAPSIVSAVLFSCSSMLIGCVGQFVFFVILSLLPLYFWGLEKCLHKGSIKNILIMSLISGALLLQPHPQLIVYIFIATLIYLPWRGIQLSLYKDKKYVRPLITLMAAMLLGLLIASPQLQALRELKESTSRGSGMSKDAAFFGSLPPEELLALYLPSVFGDWSNIKEFFPKPNSLTPYYWGRMELRLNPDHIGILAITLALISLFACKKSPFVRPIFTITVLFYSLSLGKYFISFPILYQLVPLFEYMRGTYRFIYIAIFFTCVLSGIGMDYILKQDNLSLKRIWNQSVFGITILISLTFLFWVFFNISGLYDARAPYFKGIPDTYLWPQLQGHRLVFEGYDFINHYWLTATIYALFFAIIFLILLKLFAQKTLPKILSLNQQQSFSVIVIILITIETSLVSFGYIKTFSKNNEFFKQDKITDYLVAQRDKGMIFRIHTQTGFTQWFPNKGMLYGIESDMGYLPSVPNEYMEVLSQMQHSPGIFNLINVRYLLFPINARLPKEQFAQVASEETNGMLLFENKRVLPRFYIADNYQIVADSVQRLQSLLNPEVLKGKTIILEAVPSHGQEEQSIASALTDTKTHFVEVIKYTPDLIELKTSNPGSQKFLFIGNSYSPEWQAQVNGASSKVFRANHAFQAIEIPTGISVVSLKYQNVLLRNLMIISYSAMTILSLILVIMLFRKKPCN